MKNMKLFDDRESCKIITVENDEEFRDFLNSSSYSLAILPENYSDCDDLVMMADAGDFSKWLIQNKPEWSIEVRRTDRCLMLRSNDYWLPLVFLASDVTLPVYLNLAANYIYDRMRGTLRGQKERIHLKAMFIDDKEKITKKFIYDGNLEGLKQVIKHINLNKFLDK